MEAQKLSMQDLIRISCLIEYRYNAVLEALPSIASARKNAFEACHFTKKEMKEYDKIFLINEEQSRNFEKRVAHETAKIKCISIQVTESKLIRDYFAIVSQKEFSPDRYWTYILGLQSHLYYDMFMLKFGEIPEKDSQIWLAKSLLIVSESRAHKSSEQENLFAWADLYKQHFKFVPETSMKMLVAYS